MCGQGTFTMANGEKYAGSFANNKREGTGTSWKKDGDLGYEGEFANGLFHGTGTMFMKN